MRKSIALLLSSAALAGALSTGCSYAGVGASGDKAVIARNDAFLFGMLRKTFVCKISDAGLTNCQTSENP